MGKVISFHSYRGGTGKSLVSMNLAAIYAREGKNICLFDLDFRAPSLQIAFQIEDVRYWLNDFLNGDCEIKDVLIDLTERYGAFKGKLLVGLADPSTEAVQEMAMKNRSWEMEALRRLLTMKNFLFKDMKIDYAIFDASPGIQYASVNAVVSADIAIIVSTLDALDTGGTERMIDELYHAFEKKTAILVNKMSCGPESELSENEREKLLKELKARFQIPILEIIPCYCDVLRANRLSIFVENYPKHPFSKNLATVADQIEHF